MHPIYSYSFLDYNKCAEDFTWITRGGNNHCFELDNSPEVVINFRLDNELLKEFYNS